MSEAASSIPQEAPKFKRGYVREDGMIFVCYQNGGKEYWVTPEKWRAKQEKERKYALAYREANKERASATAKKWREQNPERLAAIKKKWRIENKDRNRKIGSEWRKSNPEKTLEYERRKYAKHKDAILERNRAYRQKNRNKIQSQKREYMRMRRKEHAPYAIQMRLRCRFANAMKRKGWSKDSPMQSIVGCLWEELKAHIESQFQEGQSWENKHLWHIDHIIPCATASTEEEMKKLFHFTNLRPLWIEDNLKKGAKITVPSHSE